MNVLHDGRETWAADAPSYQVHYPPPFRPQPSLCTPPYDYAAGQASYFSPFPPSLTGQFNAHHPASFEAISQGCPQIRPPYPSPPFTPDDGLSTLPQPHFYAPEPSSTQHGQFSQYSQLDYVPLDVASAPQQVVESALFYSNPVYPVNQPLSPLASTHKIHPIPPTSPVYAPVVAPAEPSTSFCHIYSSDFATASTHLDSSPRPAKQLNVRRSLVSLELPKLSDGHNPPLNDLRSWLLPKAWEGQKLTVWGLEAITYLTCVALHPDDYRRRKELGHIVVPANAPDRRKAHKRSNSSGKQKANGSDTSKPVIVR